jgi:CHAD domain-containing protein
VNSEAELLLPDGLTAESALERLSVALEGVQYEPGDKGMAEADRVFYDTFDGRLRAAGAAAIHEHGRFGFGTLAVDAARPPQRVLAAALEPGPLRAALEPLVDVRALLPLATLRVRERRLRVLDNERKTVVRITLEEPAVVISAKKQRPLHRRLRLAAVRGYDTSLEQVRLTLERELGLEPAGRSLIDEAVTAMGGTPGGVSSKINVPLSFDERADRAVASVLQALLEVIDANLEGAIDDLDSEFLHDLRVSVRRSRSVQREFKHVFPPAELERFRGEFRWLQQATGETRDIDVYMLGFDRLRKLVAEPMQADLGPLLEVLRRRRLRAREQMVRALRSGRYVALRSNWSSFLDGLPALPLDERHAAERSIGQLTGERITKVYRQMVKRGRRIDSATPAEEFHNLRKKGKELRYLLEMFGAPLYPSTVVRPMIKALKSLQDVLGRHQDREVQVAMLRSVSADVAKLPGGAEALMAMGVLIARLSEDEQAARSEFGEHFAAFADGPQRALVKDTFS